jgi:hypothetical protein
MTLGFGGTALARPAEPGSVNIFAYYGARVALVQVWGRLYNGKVDYGEGSGLLLGDTLVATDSHVIPRLADYESVDIRVRLGGRDSEQLVATLADRATDTDFALLKLQTPQSVAAPPCPIEYYSSGSKTPPGTRLVVLGYGIGGSLGIWGGFRNTNDNDAPLWQTDSVMNVGVSGGPVFNEDGYLLGLAARGVKEYMPDSSDPSKNFSITGVNFFTPANRIESSSLATLLKSAPSCWRGADTPPAADVAPLAAVRNQPTFPSAVSGRAPTAVTSPSLSGIVAESSRPFSFNGLSGVFGAFVGAGVNAVVADTANVARPPTPKALEVFERNVSASFEKTDHGFFSFPQTFTKTVQADNGFKIDHCSTHAESANNSAGERCTVSADGMTAVFKVELRSGPFFDQFRGWWDGTITLSQKASR